MVFHNQPRLHRHHHVSPHNILANIFLFMDKEAEAGDGEVNPPPQDHTSGTQRGLDLNLVLSNDVSMCC